MKHLTVPVKDTDLQPLKIGEEILLSGTIYTARDAAHKKLVELINKGKKLPFDIDGAAIYYSGPCPAPPNFPIGPCGPTTSYRMDSYTPQLLDLGLKIMIGKGKRNDNVVESMKKNGALYLAATGGAAALLMDCVKSSTVICFPELGAEAIRKLEVKNFPVIVATKANGETVYR
ncbi:MAG: Fe-S-containing hydro-lyase [Clostridiales bacterium]|nr:Fe-S-containing hydro-lyase [Clostridiales bacterium]